MKIVSHVYLNKTFRCPLMILLIIVAMIIMFISGCVSAKFIQTGPSATVKPDDCQVEVFTSKLPDREYEELGILEGEGSFGGDTMEMVLPKMKQEACRAGGDAIIIQSYNKYLDRADDENLNVTATVIRWTE